MGGVDHYVLTNTTEIAIQTLLHGVKFTATAPGNATDNPNDPTALTGVQRNRAVTVFYKEKDTFKITFQVLTAALPRIFFLDGQPSLFCAVDPEADNGGFGSVPEEVPE